MKGSGAVLATNQRTTQGTYEAPTGIHVAWYFTRPTKSKIKFRIYLIKKNKSQKIYWRVICSTYYMQAVLLVCLRQNIAKNRAYFYGERDL